MIVRSVFSNHPWLWIGLSSIALLACGDDSDAPGSFDDAGTSTEDPSDGAPDGTDDTQSATDDSTDTANSDETEAVTDAPTDGDPSETDVVAVDTCPINQCGNDEQLLNAGSADCECAPWTCEIETCADDEILAYPGTGDCVCLPPYERAISEDILDAWLSMPRGDVLLALDLNGDGLADDDDGTELRECIDGATTDDRPECDLLLDGSLDDLDTLLFHVLVGSSRGRDADAITRVAQEFIDYADGLFDENLSDGFLDYNLDGDLQADVRLFGSLLADDPVTRFDVDGSGAFDFYDISLIARQVADATLGGASADDDVDVNQDGRVDDVDVALLADIATYTTDFTVGLLDHNVDGRVDDADYCSVSDNPRQQNFLGWLLPEADALAAFEDDTPRLMLCRADGASYLQSMLLVDTQMELIVRPSNLYLGAVSDIPDGYDPHNPGLLEEYDTFIVSSEPSSSRLFEVALPWNFETGERQFARFSLLGDDIPDSAAVLLPQAVVVVEDGRVDAQGMAAESAITFTAPIFDGLFRDNQQSSAAFYSEYLNSTSLTYEAIVNGCPCTLDFETRQGLVRGLIRASNCMAAVLATVEELMTAAENNHRTITRTHLQTSMTASLAWNELGRQVFMQEIVRTLLLVLETGYDGASGGYAKAFTGAMGNLISELISDATSTDDFFNASNNVAEANLAGLGATGGSAILGQALESAIGNTISQGALRLGPREFFSMALRNLAPRFDKWKANGLEALIKTAIKQLPLVYVEYLRRAAFNAEVAATKNASDYYDSTLNVGGLQAAAREIGAGKTLVDDLLNRLLAKLSNDGCPMTVVSTDPCAFELTTALDQAREQLQDSLDTASAALQAALDAAGSESTFDGDCLGGERYRELRLADGRVSEAAEQMRRHVSAESPDDSIENAQRDFERSLNDRTAARRSWEAACLAQILGGEGIGTDIEQAQAIRQAEDAAEAAFGAFKQAHASALETYATCQAQAGATDACNVDLTLAAGDPFAAAGACLVCVPQVEMVCCGDGTQHPSEACDPLVANSCQDRYACSDECVCECGLSQEDCSEGESFNLEACICLPIDHCPPMGDFAVTGQFSVYADPHGHNPFHAVPLGTDVSWSFERFETTFDSPGLSGQDIPPMAGTFLSDPVAGCQFEGSGMGSFAGYSNSECVLQNGVLLEDAFTAMIECTPSGFPGQPITFEFAGTLD